MEYLFEAPEGITPFEVPNLCSILDGGPPCASLCRLFRDGTDCPSICGPFRP